MSEARIFEVLKEAELGMPVDDVCRKYGVARSTYYKLRSRYGGMCLSELHRLKHLEDENLRLKTIYADLSLEHKIIKDVLEKNH